MLTASDETGSALLRRESARAFGAVFRGLILCQECGQPFVRASASLCPSCLVRTGERRRKQEQRKRAPRRKADANSSKDLFRLDQHAGWEPGIHGSDWALDLDGRIDQALLLGVEHVEQLERAEQFRAAQELRTALRESGGQPVPLFQLKYLK